jgi:hypothetical protein
MTAFFLLNSGFLGVCHHKFDFAKKGMTLCDPRTALPVDANRSDAAKAASLLYPAFRIRS